METEWQPVRIAPVNSECAYLRNATAPENWIDNVGKILRVRPFRSWKEYETQMYEVHPDDRHIVNAHSLNFLLCEHQIQAD